MTNTTTNSKSQSIQHHTFKPSSGIAGLSAESNKHDSVKSILSNPNVPFALPRHYDPTI
jgi:hypothetical protein